MCTYTDTDNTVTTARGKGGWGLGGSGQKGEKPGRKGTLGDGHMTLCGGDVLLSCALETCVVL